MTGSYLCQVVPAGRETCLDKGTGSAMILMTPKTIQNTPQKPPKIPPKTDPEGVWARLGRSLATDLEF